MWVASPRDPEGQPLAGWTSDLGQQVCLPNSQEPLAEQAKASFSGFCNPFLRVAHPAGQI